MQRAQKRDAVHQQKFFFRKSVLPVDIEHAYKFHEPRTPTIGTPPSRDESIKSSSGCGCGCGCNGTKDKLDDQPQINGKAKPNGIHPSKPTTVERAIETLVNGTAEKETVLRNCFPEVTLNTLPPANGVDDERRKVPIEEEYEEMSIEEIICGKVSPYDLSRVYAHICSPISRANSPVFLA
jgi:glutamate--cysteine ligase catalytic subunit